MNIYYIAYEYFDLCINTKQRNVLVLILICVRLHVNYQCCEPNIIVVMYLFDILIRTQIQ